MSTISRKFIRSCLSRPNPVDLQTKQKKQTKLKTKLAWRRWSLYIIKSEHDVFDVAKICETECCFSFCIFFQVQWEHLLVSSDILAFFSSERIVLLLLYILVFVAAYVCVLKWNDVDDDDDDDNDDDLSKAMVQRYVQSVYLSLDENSHADVDIIFTCNPTLTIWCSKSFCDVWV